MSAENTLNLDPTKNIVGTSGYNVVPRGLTHINMESSVRLKPLQVVSVCVVKSDPQAVVEECLARAVVGIVALLIDVRMSVAVQDGEGHVVGYST